MNIDKNIALLTANAALYRRSGAAMPGVKLFRGLSKLLLQRAILVNLRKAIAFDNFTRNTR